MASRAGGGAPMTEPRCDECHEPATYLVYAAYSVGMEDDPHPRCAHYPGAMIRACPAHLVERLAHDAETFASTNSWLVTRG